MPKSGGDHNTGAEMETRRHYIAKVATKEISQASPSNDIKLWENCCNTSFWKMTTCSIFTVAIFYDNTKRNLTHPHDGWQPTVFMHKSSHLTFRSSPFLKVFCSLACRY